MTNQNTINVDSLIADKNMSVREKFEKLMALDFPNRSALDNYRYQSVLSKTQERVLIGVVFFYTVLFPLLSVLVFHTGGMRLEAFVSLQAITLTPLFALMILYLPVKCAYFDKKLFRSFFFNWVNGKNALKQWEKEEEDYQKSMTFLQNNIDAFSADDLHFLSSCQTIPSWVSQWAKDNSAQHEKNQEIKQLCTFFSEAMSVRVQPTVEIEKTVEDSKNVSIFSKDVAKI